MSLYYLPNTFCRTVLGVFDECSEHMALGRIGGNRKWFYILKPPANVAFDCVPLNRLVEQLRKFFRRYIILRSRLIENPSDILDFFDAALESPDWPTEPDRTEKQFPKLAQTATTSRTWMEMQIRALNHCVAERFITPMSDPCRSCQCTSISSNDEAESSSGVMRVTAASSHSSSKRRSDKREIEAEQGKRKRMRVDGPPRRGDRISQLVTIRPLSSSGRSGGRSKRKCRG